MKYVSEVYEIKKILKMWRCTRTINLIMHDSGFYVEENLDRLSLYPTNLLILIQ